jgi:putative ABC transport system permease protein
MAWRTLWRNRLFSLLNTTGLALGLACCLLITLFVIDELSVDRFHSHFGTIFRIVEKQQQGEGTFDVAVTPGPLAPSLVHDYPEVIRATRIGRWSGLLTSQGQALESESMMVVDPSFFAVFSFPLLVGQVPAVFTEPDHIIISETTANRFFGPDWRRKPILGTRFTLNRDHSFTLVGVAANPPAQSHIQFEVLLPFSWLEKSDEWSRKWSSNSFHTYVQLREPDPTAFAAKVKDHLFRQNGQSDSQLFLQPLSEVYLKSDFAFKTDWGRRSEILYVRIFSVVGLIVLLLAVINFINLATARASQRAKEVGVRKSIGAPRTALIAQFLLEAFLMTTLAVGAALVLAEALLPFFNTLADSGLKVPYQRPAFWLVLFVVTVLVSILTGLYPAVFLSSFRPTRILKGIFDARQGRRLRQTLVVFQFTLAMILITGSVMIYRQLNYMESRDMRFNPSGLMYVRLKGDLRSKALLFKEEAQKLPGVAQVSVATGNLVDMNNSGSVEWEGQVPGDEFLITNMNIDTNFLSTTGMALASGRNFSTRFTSDTAANGKAFLINETAARRMGWSGEAAIGKKINFWGTTGQVVGVVKDFHFRPLRAPIEPFLFRFQPREFYFTLLVRPRPGHTSAVVSGLGKIQKKLLADQPFTYQFVEQDLEQQYRTERRSGQVLLYFSLLTIVVSCLGLFGLAAFTTDQRRKEIGIRKVLGSTVWSIVAMLNREFARLVVVAMAIAIPIAWYGMDQWLSGFAYKVPVGWEMFATGGALVLSIALLTVSFQSVKAALTNPVKSLRSE